MSDGPTWVMCEAVTADGTRCGYVRPLVSLRKGADLACPACGESIASVDLFPEAAGMADPGVPEKNR